MMRTRDGTKISMPGHRRPVPNGEVFCLERRWRFALCLVGQWIDEAKSKLRDPGLVYAYHEQGRTRDPMMLPRMRL
jgi:hypothetical protein